jgi:DNA (cytosine-5)-methyltransferase 3A
MRVLSLFDGISCARVALERSGIKVDAYYASEIDAPAIAVSSKNWPDIMRLGDVRGVNAGMLEGGGMDLLIGGSPCQDLSRANIGGKGLAGSRSSLFYEYLRILKEVKPRYFVLENVASMKRVYRDEISRELGIEPIMIDAGLVCAQQRKRLFWTNIPGVCIPHDRGILLKDVIEDGYALRDKAQTLTASYGRKHPSAAKIGTKYELPMVSLKPLRIGNMKGTKGGQGSRVYSIEGKAITLSAGGGGLSARTGLYYPIVGRTKDGELVVAEATKKGYALAREGDSIDLSFPNSTTRRGRVGQKVKTLTTSTPIHVFTKDEVRILTPIECERLTTLPDGYTEGVSGTQRRILCGNAFVVEVIAHILKHADFTAS